MNMSKRRIFATATGQFVVMGEISVLGIARTEEYTTRHKTEAVLQVRARIIALEACCASLVAFFALGLAAATFFRRRPLAT